MKRTKAMLRVCIIMLLVLALAVPVSAKTFKASDTKTAKKQITTMVSGMNFVAEAKLEKMKKGQTKTLKFNKVSDRNFATRYMYEYDAKDTAQVSRWYFGPNAKKQETENEFYDGTDHITLKIQKITRNGKYYTVKCKAMMYVDDAGAKYYNDGTVTFKFKVYPHTHFGLIIKEMKVKRTVKTLRP